MHRLGFLPEDIPALGRMLRATSVVKVRSAFSHRNNYGPEGRHRTQPGRGRDAERIDSVKTYAETHKVILPLREAGYAGRVEDMTQWRKPSAPFLMKF